jgi:hypothetical protein
MAARQTRPVHLLVNANDDTSASGFDTFLSLHPALVSARTQSARLGLHHFIAASADRSHP